VAGAAGVADSGTARHSPNERLAFAVFAALVVASFAAFFVTQRLKHTPTAVQRFQHSPAFSPHSPDPAHRRERISFKLAHDDAVTVAVIDSSGEVVATLVRDHELARYKQFSLRWNGHRGNTRRYEQLVSPTGHRTLVALSPGRLAPPGEYRVRITLRRQGREVLSPWTFRLVSR
jgi:hypothetical protein